MKRYLRQSHVRLWLVMAVTILALVLPATALAAPSGAPAQWYGCASYHTVTRGQTLSSIARYYGTTSYALMEANNIANPNRIYAGQVLCITGAGMPQPPSGCASYHTVGRGQTLSWIALYYGVSMWSIMDANGISNPNHIYTGQQLCMPGGYQPPEPPHPKPPPPGDGCHEYVIVRHGDTLAKIAWRYGTTVWYMQQINGIYNPNYIYVGQVLKTPGQCDEPYYPPQPPKPPHNDHDCGPCSPGGDKPEPPKPPMQGPWTGSYFSNAELQGNPAVVRTDPAINFDWGSGSPDPALPVEYYSAMWSRSDYFQAGVYRFGATVDDGVRIYVDNALVVNAWRVGPAQQFTGDIYLNEGYHAIRVEYYEWTGVSSIRMFYHRQ